MFPIFRARCCHSLIMPDPDPRRNAGMTHFLDPLTLTAMSIAFFHTVLGPDHYVPFVAMSRAGRWSPAKTTIVTLLCGIGHVGSSAVLGVLGVGLGVAVFKLKIIEAFRGDVAGWLLLAFGIVYFAWGIRAAFRNRPHTHWHAHDGGVVHQHVHVHHDEHLHIHSAVEASATATPEHSPRRNRRSR